MTCKHCQRTIVLTEDGWIDPEATGDDAIWRETCDNHETFVADHEPQPMVAKPYDWEHEEALEAVWVEGVALWEISLLGTPGLFASQCFADCLDEMGPERFCKWYRGTVQ